MIYQIKTNELTPESLNCNKECRQALDGQGRSKESEELCQKKIAYIALRYGFEELDYRGFGKTMPRALVEYNSLPYTDRKVETSFWSRPDIAEYQKAKKEYDAMMISNYEWLKKLNDVFNKYNDFTSASKCDAKIKEYDQCLYR